MELKRRNGSIDAASVVNVFCLSKDLPKCFYIKDLANQGSKVAMSQTSKKKTKLPKIQNSVWIVQVYFWVQNCEKWKNRKSYKILTRKKQRIKPTQKCGKCEIINRKSKISEKRKKYDFSDFRDFLIFREKGETSDFHSFRFFSIFAIY